MRRVIRTGLVLVAIAALAVVVAACGSTKTTTETSTVTTSSQTQPTTTTGATTAPHPTTTTHAVGPSSCGPNQAFSQVSHTCVNTNPNGNPCPAGEVPMADKPICVKQ